MFSNTTLTSVVPSGAVCFVDSLQAGSLDSPPCPVTSDMVAFLNLTMEFKYYFHAYCLNPPLDDGCPYGYCPNPDIAGRFAYYYYAGYPLDPDFGVEGLFVRISAYLTNFFVAILVFYQPEELNESFWSQLLSVYAILLTCGWTIIRHHLTRIHAILATATAGSPLTVCIFLYALRSLWEGKHRLSTAVGPGRIFPRSIVLIALGLWFGLGIYIILPTHLSDFQQKSCEANNNVVKYLYFLPVLIFDEMPLWSQCLAALPPLLTVLAWIIIIIIRRRQIWLRGEPFRPHFRTIWRTVKEHYPFIQFISVVAIPTAYWVAAIETGVLAAGTKDDHLEASFGQVLAMFVAVPPLLSVAKMAPRMLTWFLNLTWVRFLTGSPRIGEEPEFGLPITFTSSSETMNNEKDPSKDVILIYDDDNGHSFFST